MYRTGISVSGSGVNDVADPGPESGQFTKYEIVRSTGTCNKFFTFIFDFKPSILFMLTSSFLYNIPHIRHKL
jgi:hypothetical protein